MCHVGGGILWMLTPVIMAGGKGTRISSIANDIPKPMIDLCGTPILEHQLRSLEGQGFREFVLVIGHLGHKIIEYFGDGSQFGLEIKYIQEDTPLGTVGGLYYLPSLFENHVFDQPILLINGDVVFDIDVDRFYDFHKNRHSDITLFTHPNSHPYDSALIETDSNGQITKWLNKEDPRSDYKNRVNAGIHILEPKILQKIWGLGSPVKLDLDRDIIKPAITTKELCVYAYDSPEYVKDMGTPERYCQICKDYQSEIIHKKSLKNKQRAIFLDRDGTLNIHPGIMRFIISPDDLQLIDHVGEAIQIINNSGYLAIVVTNQPVIARGDCTIETLDKIHARLERLLGEEGAYLDDLIYCPHHPDKGFAGERLEYKIECECRKPKPGMILQMAEKYNIDLSQSFMVGDSEVDMIAGRAVGCKTVYIQSECHQIETKLYDFYADNLVEVIQRIL